MERSKEMSGESLRVMTVRVASTVTPQPVIAKLNAAINDGLKTPELNIALQRLSNEPLGGAPADFTAMIKADLDKWSPIVSSLGLNKP